MSWFVDELSGYLFIIYFLFLVKVRWFMSPYLLCYAIWKLLVLTLVAVMVYIFGIWFWCVLILARWVLVHWSDKYSTVSYLSLKTSWEMDNKDSHSNM